MSEPSPHILVVDDHKDIRETLARYLIKNGFRATSAESAAQARKALKAAVIDLIVLDVMMPGEDGLSLCRSLVEGDAPPIILLTAMAEDTDRIIGLEIGADDYVTKPFNPRELLARIKAVLRRTASVPKTRDALEQERLTFEGFAVDVVRRELREASGALVPLSSGEFQLLCAFLKRPRLVLSRDQLMDLTTGRAPGLFDRAIDNQISRLRRKIEPDPREPVFIKTVWGGGYMFTPEVKALGEETP
ncbi:response regulator [Pannonibacter sp.]|uniref:response regulator n=1 Tax=Pannonibacter sp. TaxID=1906786 RepID=UPI003F72BC5F